MMLRALIDSNQQWGGVMQLMWTPSCVRAASLGIKLLQFVSRATVALDCIHLNLNLSVGQCAWDNNNALLIFHIVWWIFYTVASYKKTNENGNRGNDLVTFVGRTDHVPCSCIIHSNNSMLCVACMICHDIDMTAFTIQSNPSFCSLRWKAVCISVSMA